MNMYAKGVKLFQGDIQELKFYPTPDAAYEVCSVPIDNCDEMENKSETSTSAVEEVDEADESAVDSNSLNVASVVRIQFIYFILDSNKFIFFFNKYTYTYYI